MKGRAFGPTIWFPLLASDSKFVKGAGGVRCGSVCEPPPGLTGDSDFWLPVLLSGPLVSRYPSKCHPQRTRATHQTPPPGTDALARLGTETPAALTTWGPQCATGRAGAVNFSTPRPREAITLVPSAASLYPLRIGLPKTKPPLLWARRCP